MALTKVTYSMISGASVNVLDFGADPTGVADSTAALTAAEAKAFADSAILYLPPGTYKQNGALAYRVSIVGYGATIQNTTSTAYTLNWGDSTLKFDTKSFLYVKGLTVNGNAKAPGIGLLSCSNMTFEDCLVTNCMGTCFNNYSGSFNSYINCVADGVIYKTTGGSGEPADGFYSGESNNTSHINCIARNFERIGFVSDGTVSDKCFMQRYVSCVSYNASNVDRSATEYNAGFWMENTNGVFMDNITVYSIGGRSGQTNGRVRGIALLAVGDTLARPATLTNFSVGDTSGTLPVGIAVSGSANLANAIVQNGVILRANIGVSTLGGLNSLTVENVQFDSMKYDAAAHGGLVVDLQGDINYVTMSNCTETQATYTNTDAATFNLFYGGTGGNRIFTLENCNGISSRTVSGIQRFFVSNNTVLARSATYACFDAEELLLSNCDLRASGGDGLFLGGNTSGTATTQVSNCSFHNFTAGILITSGRDLIIDGCKFYDSRIDWAMDYDDGLIKVSDCLWKNTTVGLAGIRANFYNKANDKLIAQNNAFYLNTVANAIALWNTSPDFVMLQGNFYNSVALSNLTITTQANNYP